MSKDNKTKVFRDTYKIIVITILRCISENCDSVGCYKLFWYSFDDLVKLKN